METSTEKSVSELNVGEILMCIKDHYHHLFEDGDLWLKKNNTYKILELNIGENSFLIIDEMKQKLSFDAMYLFDEYFIPVKELRKLKIKKINENM